MAFRATRLLLAAKPAGKSGFAKNWLSDTATYPILAIMAGACGLVAWQGQRVLLNHPDITFDKKDRSSTTRNNDEAAEKHHEHFIRKAVTGGETQIMPGLNAIMVQGRQK